MKKIYSIVMILAAAAGFTNCTKTDFVENAVENDGAVVYATTDAVTKTILADDYKVLWSEGDQIKFIKNGASTSYTFSLSSGSGSANGTFTCEENPEEGTYTVYYPATYNGTNWPAQTYVSAEDISGAPMKATATVGSDGIISDIIFANEGGILRYTVKGDKTIKSINVKSGSTLDVTLDCGTSGVALTAEGTVFNIALPAGEYDNATLKFTATDNTVASMKASKFVVTKNEVSLAKFESLNFKAVIALPGEFSVGESAKVRFSRGNLYWDGDSYEFEANQYTIGTWNATNHVNYFYWSNDASVAKAASYVDASAANTDVFFTNATETTAKSDFTVSGVTGKFRTLSADEWTYLLATRTNAANLLAEDVTVCGVAHCLVIAPDACLNGYEFNKATTSYDATAWAAAEAAGLICLPPAGYRDGTEINSGDGNGFYWSSTKDAADKASNLGF